MAELELRHLRLVCAIAEEPSLTRAAARLGVSQPSLSATLQRIERRLGGQLFERERTGMRVTELGAYLVSSARVVLADMESLLAGADARTRAPAGALRIGACPGAIGPNLARGITEILPTDDVTLEVAGIGQLAQDLESRRLDFAVLDECAGVPLPTSDRLDTRLLVAEPVFVALSEGHPLAERPTVELADLAPEDWAIAPMRDGNDQVVLSRACAVAGFRPRIRHEVNEPATCRELVAAGGAVALAQPTSRDGSGIAVRPLAGDPIILERWLVWHPAGPHAQHAADVYRCAARAYLSQLDRNPDYRRWWDRHPEAHRQLSAAIGEPVVRVGA
ncbi:LysR family transcriptional regulator [Actinocatenispora sera]|uniref:Transcriptional regulator n=1 Tax=Actinocatenispora sera TaxID=390989 RepID=A0A810KZ33_9ACTN|nr:LysR family transcriptional regulator [Actinocatenispora sera]BCJ27278.1 transcriptional regulator [Actinocatenispora sera]